MAQHNNGLKLTAPSSVTLFSRLVGKKRALLGPQLNPGVRLAMIMKKKLLMPMIFLAVLGCTKHHAVESNVIHVRSSTAEILSIKSYDIPKGIFRGVLWPSPDNGVFTAWGKFGGKEMFYDIPAPREAIGWESQSTDKWKINETRTPNGVECTLSKYNDTRTITLDLPISNKPYSFGVLKKPSGEETIILMDISEKVEGKGTVGIVVIK